MMILKQNVNFYQKEEEEFTPVLSATLLFQLWLGLFFVLALIAINAKWSLNEQNRNIEDLKKKREEVNQQLQTMSKDFKAKNSPHKMQEEIAIIKDKITKTQSAIALLQEQSNFQSYPLSSYLEGFAASHVKGMYVSHFYMENEGHRMNFAGNALSPQLVPLMVKSWESTQVMKGRRFQKLNLQQIDKNKPWVKFNLQAE